MPIFLGSTGLRPLSLGGGRLREVYLGAQRLYRAMKKYPAQSVAELLNVHDYGRTVCGQAETALDASGFDTLHFEWRADVVNGFGHPNGNSAQVLLGLKSGEKVVWFARRDTGALFGAGQTVQLRDSAAVPLSDFTGQEKRALRLYAGLTQPTSTDGAGTPQANTHLTLTVHTGEILAD